MDEVKHKVKTCVSNFDELKKKIAEVAKKGEDSKKNY